MYRPANIAGAAPVLLWMHGGAWSLGGPEFDDHWLLGIAERAGVHVVSVDYRLAPEHPFPGAIEDCRTVLRWLRQQAAALNIDGRAICVGGSSAGANLAAGLTLLCRDAGEPQPALQLLMYPALDDRLETPSMLGIDDPRTINRSFMRERWRAYLGSRDPCSYYAAPARAQDLHGLPRTSILAAELDALRDEAVAYAERLVATGIECTLLVLRGAVHGCEAIAPQSSLAASVSSWAVSQLLHATRPRLA